MRNFGSVDEWERLVEPDNAAGETVKDEETKPLPEWKMSREEIRRRLAGRAME